MARIAIPQSVAEWNQRGRNYLPGHLGIDFLAVEPDEVRARMRVERSVCAWNGFLHAGAVVSLADSCCGYATLRNLPEDAVSFSTIELKSNFIGTTLEATSSASPRPRTRAARRRSGTLKCARRKPARPLPISAAPR